MVFLTLALPESSITTTIAIIGGVVAIVIALVIAITIVTIVALISRICRGESSLKKAERYALYFYAYHFSTSCTI